MDSLHTSHHMSAHGALMDPHYLRDSLSEHPVPDKAGAVLRAGLLVALCIPLLMWLVVKSA
jgi:hypothetical protein